MGDEWITIIKSQKISSNLWRAVNRALKHNMKSSRNIIGDGESTRFWLDNCVPRYEPPILLLFRMKYWKDLLVTLCVCLAIGIGIYLSILFESGHASKL